MFLIPKKYFLVTIPFIISATTINAQMQFGVSYGGNYDFGKETPDNYKSKGILNIHLINENDTRFSPFLSLGFTKIPLNYSEVIIENQGNFKTALINSSTSIELGIESVLKNYDRSCVFARFGFGINFFSNPMVLLEESHEGFGNDSDYSANSETKFPFLDFSLKIDRKVSSNWTINFNIGTEYYPTNSSLAILSGIDGTNIEINSSFEKLRPYAKIGVAYSFKENDF